jgi:hypothetical protein
MAVFTVAAQAAAAAGVARNQQVVTALQAVSTAQTAVTTASQGPGANGQTRRPLGSTAIPSAAVGIIGAPSPQSAPLVLAGAAASVAGGPLITAGVINNNTPADSAAMAQMLSALQRRRTL